MTVLVHGRLYSRCGLVRGPWVHPTVAARLAASIQPEETR